MNNINIAQNISDLRKKAGITQEQLAQAINVSAQAISKWETNTCQPDAMTLPLIAEYFHVSIDYLFYGKDITYNDIYAKIGQKVSLFTQMSKEAYEEALKIFASAHHGISHGNIRGKELMYDEPSHISDANGISLLSGKGYGAILTRKFFENIGKETVEFSIELFSVLSDKNCCLAAMAIISMSDISFNELKEKLGFGDEILREALDKLINSKWVIEKNSKHKSLGTTYEINDMYHTCLCILLATMEMQRFSLKGISCCMGYGDYPIKLT
jgi:Predicted transcriptional regulators